jgi:hypothetical protein
MSTMMVLGLLDKEHASQAGGCFNLSWGVGWVAFSTNGFMGRNIKLEVRYEVGFITN